MPSFNARRSVRNAFRKRFPFAKSVSSQMHSIQSSQPRLCTMHQTTPHQPAITGQSTHMLLIFIVIVILQWITILGILVVSFVHQEHLRSFHRERKEVSRSSARASSFPPESHSDSDPSSTQGRGDFDDFNDPDSPNFPGNSIGLGPAIPYHHVWPGPAKPFFSKSQ